MRIDYRSAFDTRNGRPVKLAVITYKNSESVFGDTVMEALEIRGYRVEYSSQLGFTRAFVKVKDRDEYEDFKDDYKDFKSCIKRNWLEPLIITKLDGSHQTYNYKVYSAH